MNRMNRVTVVTPWRQHAGAVLDYERQMAALDYPQDRLRFVFVENDSTDETYPMLSSWAALDARVLLRKQDRGYPLYPSVVNPHRFEILATVFNWALDLVDYDWTDYVLFMPCDIAFQPDLLRRLLDHRAPLVSPFVFQNGIFYDTWAFRRDGRNFPPFAETDTEAIFGRDLVRMETMGCVMLIDADVLRAGVRYSTVNVDRGLCEAARAAGYALWADPTLRVYHGVIR